MPPKSATQKDCRRSGREIGARYPLPPRHYGIVLKIYLDVECYLGYIEIKEGIK